CSPGHDRRLLRRLTGLWTARTLRDAVLPCSWQRLVQLRSARTGEPMVAMPKMVPYAAGLAAVLALGACSGGNPATAETVAPPSVTSPSSAPSATSSVPTTSQTPMTTSEDPVLAKIPKEARAKTEKGAESFVAFYLDSLNVALSKPDPSLLEGLYDSSCSGCRALRDDALELARQHQRHDGTTITLKRATAIQFVQDRKEVEAEVVQNPIPVVDASGGIVRRNAGKEGLFLFTLAFDDGWKVVRLQASAS
ncbi:MAG TPA: DUF6318 family protein, partial [Intrasporangium sp.]|nr:DUF6318 family protein [Intrasporangium sp.]